MIVREGALFNYFYFYYFLETRVKPFNKYKPSGAGGTHSLQCQTTWNTVPPGNPTAYN